MCKMHTRTPSSMREKNPNIPYIRTPPQLQQCFTTSMGTNTTLFAIVAKAPAMYGMHQQVMSCAVTLKLLIHHLIHSTKCRACTGPLLAPNPCVLSLCSSPLTPTLGFLFGLSQRLRRNPSSCVPSGTSAISQPPPSLRPLGPNLQQKIVCGHSQI